MKAPVELRDAPIWAALPVPAVILDDQDRVLVLNPAAEDFLNISDRAARGQLLLERIAPGAGLAGALARVRRNGTPLYVDALGVHPHDRAPVPCGLQVGPHGEAGMLIVLITPRDLAGRLGQADSARPASKSAISMAEILAHEIKNPLAGIAGAAQLLAMNLTGADRELTDLIVGETRRIADLVDGLELFGNLRPARLRAMNIHDVLDRACRTAELGFASGRRIIREYDPSLPATLGDNDQLLQLFLNLIRNAAEALGDTGQIRLRSYYDPALRLRGPDGAERVLPMHVEVIDDGPGIPEAIAQDMFAPFVSGRKGGTGLGLALVARIADAHHGWIAAESRPGHTVFRLSLPLAPREPRKEDV